MSKAKRYTSTVKDRFVAKGALLYILPIPIALTIILSFFSTNGGGVIRNVISLALFIFAAKLTKNGLKAQRDYEASPIAKAPKYPLKLISATILSFATYYTSSVSTNNSTLFSLVLALSAFVGYYLYYGFDPKVDKLPNLPAGVDAQDVIDITDDALKRIEELESVKNELKNPTTKAMLSKIIDESRHIVHEVQSSPVDLSKARKFFKIYLDRSQKISDEYLKNYKLGNVDEQMEGNYNKLLESVVETIQRQKEKLNDDDIMMLDVQIEALTKQIKHEGL